MERGQFLRFSANRPAGWLRDYMHVDLRGFVGHLDELVPALIQDDQIFGHDRRTDKGAQGSTGADLGVAVIAENCASQYRWWNAESQGNWMDGFVRTATLLEEPDMLEKAKTYVEKYLATQDADGYLGIYQEDLRFTPGRENGEFWAQSVMLRCLLAYYQYTQDERVLEAVKKAVARIMEAYPVGSDARPFDNSQEPPNSRCTGIGHGLTVVDAFYTLYELTGEKKYWEYAVWLYRQFNVEKGGNMHEDVMLANLLNPDYRFHCHAVHTFEQARALMLAAYGSDEPKYRKALDIYLDKVDKLYTCPSGGPIGDEDVRPEGYDPTVTAYEYCTIHELLHSYALMMELSGDLGYADKIETLLFNAGMGAHLPGESAITYCKSDNCYSLSGEFQCAQPHSHYGDVKQTRFKYSPAHQDVAVCCVPNAGRIMPYYIASMWLKEDASLTKALYGPSVLHTEIDSVPVRIEEESNYPFDNTLTFRVKADKEVTFDLKLRVPGWAIGVVVNGVSYQRKDGCVVISRSWRGETVFTLRFAASPEIKTDILGDAYITYGALVMALPIEAKEKIAKEHPLPGFYDKYFTPVRGAQYDYSLYTVAVPEAIKGELPQVAALFRNNQTGAQEKLILVPMGKTILRRVTFPKV